MSRNESLGSIVRACLADSRGSVALACLSMVAMTITDLVRPWPLKIIFDHILLDQALPDSFSFASEPFESNKTSAVVAVASLIVIIAAVRGLFAYVESFQTAKLGNLIACRIRNVLFSHLQRLSLGFHAQARTGELMTKIASDTSTIKTFISDSLLLLGSHVLIILGSFGVMFLLNWRLALVVFASFPILVTNIFILHRRATVAAKTQRSKEDRIATRINEALTTVQLTQAFGRERHEQSEFENESNAYLDQSLKNARIESAAARAVEITTAIGTCGVVLYGSLQVLRGAMSPGTVLVFSSYLHGLYRPIRRLVKMTIRFSRLQVSIQRVSEVLAYEQDIKDGPLVIRGSQLKGEIEFDHVSFAYSQAEGDALRNVSFRIPAGARVAIVGASGAGKSTLIGLILRLYDPRAGQIRIDGMDLKQFQLESLREQIGIVLQESVLRGVSVAENIAYGRPGASVTDIQAAARRACAHDFIVRLENGYGTIVGEQGARLSGGQRRRIAIARALIRNASILLMDEPMTGVDGESERQADEAIARLTEGRTCVTITHDLQAAMRADHIIVLENGSVVESGSPRKLIDMNGLFERRYSQAVRRNETRSTVAHRG